MTSCEVTPKDSLLDIMDFGIEHDVFLELQFEERYLMNICDDMEIFLYEGNRLVGVGVFTDKPGKEKAQRF